jgi:hypothetical protein
MTFDEFIQDGLGKANKLFAKLAQSGPNAIKTRERLFLDLKAEFNHLNRFERHHLIPALGDQRKTRALVKALEKDIEKVAELLAELDNEPRNGDAFLQKVEGLQKAFQAHVRDERKDLLPAVLEALQRAQAAERDAAELQVAARKAAELKAAQEEALVQTHVSDRGKRPAAADTRAAFAPPETPAPEPMIAPFVDLAALKAETVNVTPPEVEPPKAGTAARISPPSPTAVYGVQAWANLMQEAAASALMGYRLMLAYSNNTGLAALQARLMKEQLELMTKSSSKMIETAERLTKVVSRA